MVRTTKRIRLTRKVTIDGKDAEIGSVHLLPAATAEMLIGHGSAVELNFVWRFLDSIRKRRK